jgi:hypothetical protein
MKFRYSILSLALGFLLICGPARALTPASYVAAEIGVRSITLEQLRERQSGNESGTDYQQRIQAKYREYHTTPGQHVRYANDHQAEIDHWLAEHPDEQAQLDAIQSEFDYLISAD